MFRRKSRYRKSASSQITSATLENVYDRRSFAIAAFGAGIGTLLTVRMGYIAIAENEKYRTEAESNRVNLSLIPPRRGWILDRNGAPLASNRADFRVDVIPERMTEADREIAVLGDVLALDRAQLRDLRERIEQTRGFRPVEVGTGLSYEQFAALSVRLPELPGVVPQRGFSRFYPTGPSVGHLIGYVGPASAEEYEADRSPLLITPGYKIGKDGLEKQFEQRLRGVPGARRVEVTAAGRIVRDLETREDVQGQPVKLTIDGPLQDYAARRIGLESGSVVVMDCRTGDLLCMASMPSFDPNSFSDGIGSIEYAMLREDERVPLRNKVLKGRYPPGSTIKPMVSMAFLREGLDPEESVYCGGGLRVGNRVFRCWKRGGHGHVNMAKGIYQSCDVYYYHFAQRLGRDPIAAMARRCGMGQEFDLPVLSQFYIILATFVILGLDGHLILVSTLAESFRVLPVGLPSLNFTSLWEMVNQAGWAFGAALQLALPAIVTLLVVNFAFGVISRAAPQLHIIVIGFPLTLEFGFIVIWLTYSTVVGEIGGVFGHAVGHAEGGVAGCR